MLTLADKGVVGMAGPAGVESVFSQLASAKAVPAGLCLASFRSLPLAHLVFSRADAWGICLNPGATSNGTLTLGGADPRLYHGLVLGLLLVHLGDLHYLTHIGDLAYTASIDTEHYVMNFAGLTVGGVPVKGVESTIIIDSGAPCPVALPCALAFSLR